MIRVGVTEIALLTLICAGAVVIARASLNTALILSIGP